MATNQPAGIGHNRPPLEVLKEDLIERHEDIAIRAIELGEAAKRLPAAVTTEAMATKVTTFVGQCRAATKALKAAHKIEKDEYLRGGQVVDRHFKELLDKVEVAIAMSNAALQPYLDAKIKAERERLEKEAAEYAAREKARLEKEAAERKQVEEAEALAAAAEAEEARKVADMAAAAAAQASGEMKDTAEAAALELAHRAEEAKRAAEDAAAEAAKPVEEIKVEAVPVEDVRVRVAGPDNRALGKTVWTWRYTGKGPEGFDLNTVRKWMDPKAVSDAINDAVKDGVRQLGPCVEVYETTQVKV